MKAERLRELLKSVHEELSQLTEAEYWQRFDEHAPGDIASFIEDMGLLNAATDEVAEPKRSAMRPDLECSPLSTTYVVDMAGLKWLDYRSAVPLVLFDKWATQQSETVHVLSPMVLALPVSNEGPQDQPLLDVCEWTRLTIPPLPLLVWTADWGEAPVWSQPITAPSVQVYNSKQGARYSDLDEDLQWAA